MTDVPAPSGKSKASSGEKSSGTSSNKPGKGPTKPSTVSKVTGSSQQSEQPGTSSSTTKQSEQAESSGETQQSPQRGAAQSTQGGAAHTEGDGEKQAKSRSQNNLQANLEITKQCEELVESFRRGQLGKGAAIMALALALRGAAPEGTDNDTIEAAFESYAAQLDEIAKYREENRPSNSRDLSPDQGAADNETRNRSQTLGKPKGKGRASRARSSSTSRSNSPDGRASVSFSEDARPASKKQKQDPSLFAWTSQENEVAESALCAELQETLRLIRNHDFDIKSARSSLRNSVGVPEFPESEWTNVLLGRYIDLNHVLSGQYTLEQDEKTVQKLGLVELTYRTVTPSKVIKSSGDWVTVWQRTTAAILYVFPHRRAELDSYCQHLIGLFGSILPSHHNRVIDYDRAVRKRAGAMHTLLLTDFSKFNDLRDRFTNSFGIATDFADEEGRRRGTGRRRPRSKEDEACRRWNRGACDAGDAACKYVHRCSGCGAADHTLPRCDKNSRRKA